VCKRTIFGVVFTLSIVSFHHFPVIHCGYLQSFLFLQEEKILQNVVWHLLCTNCVSSMYHSLETRNINRTTYHIHLTLIWSVRLYYFFMSDSFPNQNSGSEFIMFPIISAARNTRTLLESHLQIIRPFRRKIHASLTSDRFASTEICGVVDKSLAYTRFKSLKYRSKNNSLNSYRKESLCLMYRCIHSLEYHVTAATAFHHLTAICEQIV
jgi:hypothetical protein